MADERIDVEVSRFDGEGIMFFFACYRIGIEGFQHKWV